MPRVFDQADKLASHAEGESLYEVLKNGLASYARALGLPEETQELFKSALFVPENINPIARTILLALTYLQLTGIYTDYHRSHHLTCTHLFATDRHIHRLSPQPICSRYRPCSEAESA